MTRTRLLSGTALIGFITLSLFPGQVLAACNNNLPADGATISCTGTDTTGISGGANNVVINVGGATISTTGINAINLGTGAIIQLSGGTVNSTMTAINLNGGNVYSNGTITGGNGTAIDFGTGPAQLQLYAEGTINGNVLAGTGNTDTFRLRGTTTGTLNTSDIGTKYTGFENFIKSESSAWILTGTGNQAWTIQAGILQGNTTSMSGNLAVSNGANVTFNQTAFGATNGIISGAGSLTVTGNNTLTLNSANTYTGGTTISAGTGLQGTTTSLTGNILNNSNLLFNQGTNGTFAGVISGTGVVYKYGTGIVTLAGTNTYSGLTRIQAGTINVSSTSNLGSGSIVLDGGTLQSGAAYTNTKNVAINSGNGTIDSNGFGTVFSGVISGTGPLTKSGTGSLTLSGANTYSGGTIINAGNLNVSTTSLTGNVTDNATLTFSQTGSGTYNGIVSGTGGIAYGGGGTITVTGANTYTGATSIANATVIASADNNLGAGNSLLINNGNLQYAAGFSSAKNISISSGTGAVFNTNGFNSSLTGVISGSGGLTKTGTGTLTLAGTNTYTGSTTVSAGALLVSANNNLGATSGALTINSASLVYGASFDTSRNIVTGNANLNTNGFNSNISGVVSGTGAFRKSGTGTLTLSGTNIYTGGTIISGGILNVSNNNNLGGTGTLTFESGTLQSGAAYTLSRNVVLSTGGGTIDTNGFASTVSGVISGTGSLTKTSIGVLTLTGNNTYTGGTAITGGSISVSSDANLGDTNGGLVFNSGTLNFTSSFSSARDITITSGVGSLNTGTSDVVLSGIISGTGSVSKSFGGTLTLTGNNTYTGGTSIIGGALIASSDSNLGAASGGIILNAGTLRFGSSFDTARNINIGTSNGTLDTNGNSATVSGVISGTGRLTKIGAGVVTLSGTNTYTGGTTISGGTVNISNNNNLGGTGTLTLNGGALQSGAAYTLSRNIALGAAGGTFDTNGFATISSGVISGSTGLIKTGTGMLTLTGTNTYSGGTTVSDGTLTGTTSSLQGAITNNSSVIFNQATSGTYADVMSGTGSLAKSGTGTLTLSGTNTYTGGTTISGGTVIVNSSSNLGDLASDLTLDSGILRFGTSFTTARNIILGSGGGTLNQAATGDVQSNGLISGSGSLEKTGSQRLIVRGSNTYAGGTIISGGILNTAIDANLGDLTGALTLNGGTWQHGGNLTSTRDILITSSNGTIDTRSSNSSISGVVSGSGMLFKTGSGTLTLSGLNTYSGGTTISNGTLSGNTDSLQGNILNNSILNFAQSFNNTYSGIISGSGSLTKTGAGNLILSGINSYAGGTTVSAGRLSVNGTISGTTIIDSTGTLGGNGNFGTIIANGRIAPGNSIGTMNVTGPVTFNSGSVYEVEVDAAGNSDKLIASGALTINGGTVDVRAGAGSYGDHTVYTNILQGASRTGSFDSATSNFAFLTPTLTYDSNSVDLTLDRNDVDFSAVANDEVQVNVANAVQALGSGNDLYNAFTGLNMTEAATALDTLSGEHNAGITTATSQSTATVRNVISNRIETIKSNQTSYASITPAAGDEDTGIPKNYWNAIFGYRGHSDALGTAPAQNRESSGALFGADAEPTSDILVGIFGGYERGEIYTDTQFANSDANSWHAGIYSSYNSTPSWRIAGGIIGTYHNIDTTRHIEFTGFSETSKGKTDGYTISPSVETSYTFSALNTQFEPFAGFNFTHSHIGSYSEVDGGSANLDVDSASQSNFSHTLGMRFSKAFDLDDETLLNLRANLGWNHTYGNLDSRQAMQFSSGNTPFEVEGANLSRNNLVFGTGADMPLGSSASKAYIDYNGAFSQDAHNHGVTLGVKIPF